VTNGTAGGEPRIGDLRSDPEKGILVFAGQEEGWIPLESTDPDEPPPVTRVERE
jgi:hypothetical protein